MGRFSSTMSRRPRSERTRRRVLFCAESLESRQLLSVAAAAFHPAITPVGNVPAAVGPVVPSPAGSLGTAGSAAGSTAGIQAVLQINPVVTGQNAFGGFSEVIVIIEVPASGGLGVTAPTASSNSAAPMGPINSPTSTNSAVSAPTSQITALTATVLAGPGAANQAPVIAIIVPLTPVINLASSTIPATTQAILATAAFEEQPIQPPVLGQGFESGQTQSVAPRPDIGVKAPSVPVPFNPQIPATDYIEPYQPALENAPGAQPGRPVEAPAAPALPRNAEPVEALLIEPAALTDWDKAPEFPILPPRTDAQAETPSWNMAAMVGTAAIASGGYHLVLGRSSRFNQRWLPNDATSKKSRGRKSG